MDKHRLSLIVIGVLAAAIVFGGWLIGVQPQIARIDTANDQTSSISQINDVQQIANDALKADNENLPRFKADLAARQSEIPADRNQQELINQLDAAASAAGVTISALRFDVAAQYTPPTGVDVTGAAGGTLIQIPLTLNADGPRAQLEDFVGNLQESSRIVTISSSRYSGGEESAVELTGTTWVLMPAGGVIPEE